MGLHDLNGHSQPTVVKSIANNKIDPLKDVKLTLDLPACLYGLSDNALKQAIIKNNGQLINFQLAREGNSIILTIPSLSAGFSPDGMGKYRTEIALPNDVPSEWMAWSTESDDGGPDESTTFGLIYLVNGMFKALESGDTLLKVSFEYSN